MIESVIKCPCGSTDTHLSSVEVFSRADEAKTGLHAKISVESQPSSFTYDNEMDGNPSSRRSGIILHCWCEHHDPDDPDDKDDFDVYIQQHKGVLYTSLQLLSDDEVEVYGCPVVTP
jgi:hypothetical protein